MKLTTIIGAHTATSAPALLLTETEAGFLLDAMNITALFYSTF